MDIFLSSEAEAPASSYWSYLQKDITEKLKPINEMNYGEEFESIAIISIIMSDKYIDGYPERKLIKRKRKEADIRLQIDYKSFIHATQEKRRLIYIKHIIESIKEVKQRSKGNFDGDKLIEDVLRYLDVSEEQLGI